MSFLRILSCVLGWSIFVGTNAKGRIIYLLLIFLSFYISNDLINVATDFKFEERRITVENLEELDKLNLTIYSRLSESAIFKDETLTRRFVRLRAFSRHTYMKCFRDVLSRNDRICADATFVIQAASARFRAFQNKGLRVTKFAISTFCSGNAFSRHSPFVDEYNSMVLRSYDSGVLFLRSSDQSLRYEGVELNNEDYNVVPNRPSDFYWSIFFVVAMIYSVAFLVLCLEFLCPMFHLIIREFKETTVRILRKLTQGKNMWLTRKLTKFRTFFTRKLVTPT